MRQKLMTMMLIGAVTLGTLTACGARRDSGQSAPSSEALSAQAEQELDELISALETERTPEELEEFVP
jgi:hypothetical protein